MSPREPSKHFTYWVIFQLPDLVFFEVWLWQGSFPNLLGKNLPLSRSGNIDLGLILTDTWKRHRESYLQILEGARVTLPSFLALFFIWGLKRVAATGRKPFETWSSSNWDKLKEMLLCRVESDLRECYIPKAKGWEYTQIKNTNDILINYVYENNPNGQQYGNS